MSAETLFGLLKIEFANYINAKLGSNLAIEYGHMFDVISVSIDAPIAIITSPFRKNTWSILSFNKPVKFNLR